MRAHRGPYARFRPAATFPVAPVQAETTSWQGAVVTNGGTVSAGRFAVVNNFIYAEKQLGLWALTDDYWALWGENTAQALTSLKQLRLSTAVAAPAFTADRGYQFDGATTYLRTGFIPSTMATLSNGTSGHLCVYVLTGTSGGFDIGCAVTGTSGWTLRSRNGTSLTYSLNSSSAAGIPAGAGAGFFCATRTADTFEGFRAGASLGTFVPGAFVTAALAGIELYIGALNSNGVAGTFSTRLTGFLAAGAALSAAQNMTRYNNVQTWAAAVGANV